MSDQMQTPNLTGQPVRRARYSDAKRTTYGLLWAGWTALAGRYDYRIWTWQARP